MRNTLGWIEFRNFSKIQKLTKLFKNVLKICKNTVDSFVHQWISRNWISALFCFKTSINTRKILYSPKFCSGNLQVKLVAVFSTWRLFGPPSLCDPSVVSNNTWNATERSRKESLNMLTKTKHESRRSPAYCIFSHFLKSGVAVGVGSASSGNPLPIVVKSQCLRLNR